MRVASLLFWFGLVSLHGAASLEVAAWGDNIMGQLGDGTRTQPNGNVFSWGSNNYGELGDGTTTYRLTPVAVQWTGGVPMPPQGVAQATAGAEHTVALGVDGNVFSWGANSDGQLGDGTTTRRLTPVAVRWTGGVPVPPGGIAHVTTGFYHTVAVGGNGLVFSWGQNEDGQLGDGTTTRRLTPVAVRWTAGVPMPPGGIVEAAAGGYFTVAVAGNGRVYSWGENRHGQLGDGTTRYSLSPVAVQWTASVMPPGGVAHARAGTHYTVAVGGDGGVFSWGDNQFGQLGDGTRAARRSPVAVQWTGDIPMPPGGVAMVAAGEVHAVALSGNGTVYAWGDNSRGQLGDGTTATRLAPVLVQWTGNVVLPPGGVTEVAARGVYTVSLLAAQAPAVGDIVPKSGATGAERTPAQ